MEWITSADWPGGTTAAFEELNQQHGDPEGLLDRYVGAVPGGVRVVAVWESKTAAERFFAHIPDAVKDRLAPATNGVPTVTAFAPELTFHRQTVS